MSINYLLFSHVHFAVRLACDSCFGSDSLHAFPPVLEFVVAFGKGCLQRPFPIPSLLILSFGILSPPNLKRGLVVGKRGNEELHRRLCPSGTFGNDMCVSGMVSLYTSAGDFPVLTAQLAPDNADEQSESNPRLDCPLFFFRREARGKYSCVSGLHWTVPRAFGT